MRPATRKLIEEVACRRRVDPKKIVGRCRSQAVFYARVEVAKQLSARGYTTSMIGAVLGHDHTTIVYYLGRAKKRPKPEPEPKPARKQRWKPPRVRHVRWLTRAKPTDPGLYLVPYAGADMTEYHWRKRSHAHTQDHG